MFQSTTITFLKALAKNNTKVWFDEHRDSFLTAKNDFEKFVASVIEKAGGFDADVKQLQVKDCTFRINRDIRFSTDKTPYKTNMGASFNKQGKKSMYAGYYFHLEPGNKSFAGGGLWMPMAPELKKVRQEIDYNYDEFNSILSEKRFVTHYKSLDTTGNVKLVNLPRGYDKSNAAAEFLKLKSFVAIKNISDAELTEPSLVVNTSATFKALRPFITFLNQALT